jgi:hypothetical protein
VPEIHKGDTVTSPDSGVGSAAGLPDYAPIRRSALGPALNDRGYYVGRVERDPYWVTDGVREARHNNLGDVDADVPLWRTVAVAGVSGSDKTSLAIETLTAGDLMATNLGAPNFEITVDGCLHAERSNNRERRSGESHA